MKKTKKTAKKKAETASFSRVAWISFNHRRKKKGFKIMTFEKWVEMKKEGHSDSAGRFNPRMAPAIKKMEKKFGKRIYTEKQKCVRCKKTKFLVDFVVRYDKVYPGIQPFCRECERTRLKLYSQEG